MKEGYNYMNTYKTMKEQHQKEVNDFPMFFAFSNKQFEEGMKKLGLNSSETDKIYSLNGGGYYKKTDAEKLHNMFARHDEEMKKEMSNSEFVYDMFDYELGNHEYTYTYDITQTIDSLGLSIEEINSNPILLEGLQKACRDQREWDRLHG